MAYKLMLYGGLVGTLIMLTITVVIFIKGNVYGVIKDILGIKTIRKKSSKRIDSANNTTGNVGVTNGIKTNNSIRKNSNIKPKEITARTLKINNVIAHEEGVKIINSYEDESTTILNNGEDTELLDNGFDEETSILGFDGETEILDNDDYYEETTILSDEDNSKFASEISIMVVNSKLII